MREVANLIKIRYKTTRSWEILEYDQKLLKNEAQMTDRPSVDVCLQVFGKPWQTALALLTLDKYMGPDLNKIFFVTEAASPKNDPVNLGALNALVPNMELVCPSIWHGVAQADLSRLEDGEYRQGLRYQYAFEQTGADYLMLMHNDVIFKKNVIQPFLDNIGAHIAIGEIGQCWNCPAKREDLARMANINGNGAACRREEYDKFKCDFEQLNLAYKLAREWNCHLRHEAEKGLTEEYRANPWPWPECRVNEWCCLINMRMAREATLPLGSGRPFGAYIKGHDLGSAWFRDMHRQGFTAKHFDLSKYLIHQPGHKVLFNPKLYRENEMKAERIVRRAFPEAHELLKNRGLS